MCSGLKSSSNRGFDLEDLVENAQASEMEIIAALDEGPAFVLDGKWRGIEPSYLDHVMDVAIVNARVSETRSGSAGNRRAHEP